MTELRFYFDESVEVAVSEQLRRHGIDAISAHSLDMLGADDIVHLRQATEMERMLCTYADDFLVLSSQVEPHAGILFARRIETSIGDWIKEARSQHATDTAEQARGVFSTSDGDDPRRLFDGGDVLPGFTLAVKDIFPE